MELFNKAVVFVDHVAGEGEGTDTKITVIREGEGEERVIIKSDLVEFVRDLETFKELDLLPEVVPGLLVALVGLLPDRTLLHVQISQNLRDLGLVGQITVNTTIELEAEKTLPLDASTKELERTELLFFGHKEMENRKAFGKGTVAVERVDHVGKRRNVSETKEVGCDSSNECFVLEDVLGLLHQSDQLVFTLTLIMEFPQKLLGLLEQSRPDKHVHEGSFPGGSLSR